MGNKKLSRDTWVAAGFQSLARSGPKALQINLLAKGLGATKGSFYWHFKDLEEYKRAMIALWRTKVATEVIQEVSSEPTAEARLEALFLNAARSAPEEYGGQKMETAMRAWALSDPDVATSLAELDTMRMAFLENLLEDLGLRSAAYAALIYGAYIGLDDLQSKGHVEIHEALHELMRLILAKSASQS